MNERKINKRRMNATRVCVGIGRIGYTPANAICDIIDNSVTHGAKNIHVMIKKKNDKCNINKKDNVEEYLIIYCLLYTSPSTRDRSLSRMPSSA